MACRVERAASWTRVEGALSAWVAADAPARLGDAMRYAVLDGGKRVRPLLVLAGGEAVGGDAEARRCARRCAVELIHAYSLVHDDLPCMDNDVLRRGKPTVHVQFGEARRPAGGRRPAGAGLRSAHARRRRVAPALQASCAACWRAPPAARAWPADRRSIWPASAWRSTSAVRDMHRLKTGALLQGSVDDGRGLRRGAATPAHARAATNTARPWAWHSRWSTTSSTSTPTRQTLGKTAGKDAAQRQADLCLAAGPGRAPAPMPGNCCAQACRARSQRAGRTPRALRALADMVVDRDN